MGLLSGLLLFPLTGPVYGLKFVLEQIQAQVDAQMLDEGRVMSDLMTIGMQHETGEISEEEYASQEAALLDQLNAIRAYKAGLAQAETEADPAYANPASTDPAYDGDAP
jgi:hypothetical protein